MKKLNKKGFTLIELLAVIVILAIIVVVTVPTILNSINDARLSSLHSLAKEVANQYDTAKAQELISTNKVLDKYVVTENWQCFADIKNGTTTLADVLALSKSDLVLTTVKTEPKDGDLPCNNVTGEILVDDIGENACSAIRINSNGSAEVLLIAKNGGKFAISNEVVYAISTDTNGKTVLK